MLRSPRIPALAAGALVLATLPAAGAADEHAGMCSGRSDPSVVVTAHATGPAAAVKLILNLTTDPSGSPTGTMVLGRGAERVMAEEWCRLWQHVPGQQPGQDSGGHDGTTGHEPGDGCTGGHDDMATEGDEGATVVHAVGAGRLSDGTRVRVRIDARDTDDGLVFRVRHRPMGAGHGGTEVDGCADDTGGCDTDHDPGGLPGGPGEDHEPGGCADDGGWTKVPAEGWHPLTQLRVHAAEPEA